MGTKPRVWYPGAAYHVTARGNHKNDIFKDKQDFQVYLSIIEQAIEYYENMYEVICYCLMTNHVHMLVETKEKQLGYFVGRVNSIYAKYFNSKYDYVGHLFQDRYFSSLIENCGQMLVTSQYIHLNPVRANMVNRPEDYEWSSYSMIIGLRKEKLIKCNKILSYFHEKNSRERYKEFVLAPQKKL
ncbi:REP element-mobilizing transposase RayT [Clostridium punense]|uniref:REP element-mobilizing transposase RayT n=1 Tax=Clostridium punense TaxID=1054297 RepID=A0ABS4K044_9CLOT|nr:MULTISPECIES: transposase [Clostridium]EQB88399.1 hypothetical protein M918_04455 [Clostridium sp. BL8]MBP2021158.1 REP element-mobilizing transposase RayT [Clostridium punense]